MCADRPQRDPAPAVLFVIHWEWSDQPQAFLKQKPHGVSNGKAFADWGL